jgi:membrane protein implicated in regulation of membrane protease activity
MISISYIWITIAIVCFVLELMTPTFSFLSITFGAIFGWLTSLIIDNVVIQLVIFLIAFAIFFIKLKPLIYKKNKEKFNIEAWIGTNVYSDSVITSTSGTIKKDGSFWQTRSEEDETFEKGEKLIIKKIVGNKLIVTKDVE